MINLSKAAANEIIRLRNSRQKGNCLVRLGVQEGGCSGLFYTLEFDSTLSEQAQNYLAPEDSLYESEGIAIIVNEHSYNYLKGLHLDYSEDLMGGGFRFHNPNAVSTCGCGHSFTL